MIADEILDDTIEASFVEKIDLIDFILNSIGIVTPKFIHFIKNSNFYTNSLNEEQLTQQFINLLQRELVYLQYPFCVGLEYRDIYTGSKGRPDFYFYLLEEGSTTQAIFQGEAKRLPSPPPKNREREYVKGTNSNGGIERFKIGTHGRGLARSCMLAFIQSETHKDWIVRINSWIEELAATDKNWSKDEILFSSNIVITLPSFVSIVVRVNDAPLILHHFWIALN